MAKAKKLPTTYSPFHKTLHWTMAALILGMLIFGWYLADAASPLFVQNYYFLHESFGIIVLTLVLARSLNRFFNPQPLVDEGPVWQRWTANAAHLSLYALMLVMPLTGWLMTSAGGHAPSFFGLFTLPPLLEQNPALGKQIYGIHALAATIFWWVIGLHVAGAAYHQFIKKDGTLKRMLP